MKMNTTKFSVIIPVYNTNETFLRECFSSVLNISYDNFEVIVVDDGSNTETKKILNEYENKFSFIHQENKGLVKARLEGLKLSTGDYIIFLDSDDIISSNSLSLLNDVIDKYHPDVFIHDPARFKYSIDKIEFHNKYFEEGLVSKDDAIRELCKLHLNSLCNKFAKRELYDGIEKVIDSSIFNGEDVQQSTYLLLNSNVIYYIDKPIQYYRLPVVENSYYDINRIIHDVNFLVPVYKQIFVDHSEYNKFLNDFNISATNAVIYNSFRIYKTNLSWKEKVNILDRLNSLEIVSILKNIKEKMPITSFFLFSLLINKQYLLLGLFAKIYQLLFGIVH